jgi:hypothetical protein
MLNRDHFVTTLALLVVAAAFAQVPRSAPLQPWSGSARCEIAVQGPGYSEQQTHSWILLGSPPTKQGAMQIQAATWSVTGKGSLERTQGQQTPKAQWTTNVPGMSAPIAVLIRASDGKRIIKPWHAQLRGRGAVSGSQQLTIDGKPQTPATISLEAFEWAFPVIQVSFTQTTVSGSNSPKVTGSVGPMQPAGSHATASCTWSFGKGSAEPSPSSMLN